MAAGTTVKDGEVPHETPKETVLNFNINRPSCLDRLVKAINTSRVVKNVVETKKPPRESDSAVLGVGASFITLGCFVVVMAVIFAVAQPAVYFWTYGTLFWVGFPFIVCGVLNVVASSYPTAIWDLLAYISLLVSLAVSFAATVLICDDNGWSISLVYLCETVYQSQEQYYPKDYDGSIYNEPSEWNIESCKKGFDQAQNLLISLDVMCLLMMIWGICLSSVTLGYRLDVVLIACKCKKDDNDQEKGDHEEEKDENRDDIHLLANPTADICLSKEDISLLGPSYAHPPLCYPFSQITEK